MIEVGIRLLNSLSKYGRGGATFSLALPPDATVGDAVARLQIPESEIFLILHNGRNVMETFGGSVEKFHPLKAGDQLAFSGPIPFSRAYGAGVC